MVSPKFLADFSREDTTTLHKGGRQRFYVAHVRPGNVAKSIRIAMYVLHKYIHKRTKRLYSFYMWLTEKDNDVNHNGRKDESISLHFSKLIIS